MAQNICVWATELCPKNLTERGWIVLLLLYVWMPTHDRCSWPYIQIMSGFLTSSSKPYQSGLFISHSEPMYHWILKTGIILLYFLTAPGLFSHCMWPVPIHCHRCFSRIFVRHIYFNLVTIWPSYCSFGEGVKWDNLNWWECQQGIHGNFLNK